MNREALSSVSNILDLFSMPCDPTWHTCEVLCVEETEHLNQWYGELWFTSIITKGIPEINERIDWIDDHIYAPHALCSTLWLHKPTDLHRLDLFVAFEDPAHAMQFRLRWDPVNV